MKKFTKGCLLTALGLFVVGIILFIAFGFLGGFAQLDNHTQGEGGWSWPFKLYGSLNDVSDWREVFSDENGDLSDEIWGDDMKIDKAEWEKMTTLAEEKTKLTEGKDIRNIELQIGACYFELKASEDENIWIELSKKPDKTRYFVSGDTLKVVSRISVRHSNWGLNTNVPRVTLYLPEGMELENLDGQFGAGYFYMDVMKAQQVGINVGAGDCDIRSLEAKEVDISSGAGNMDIGLLKTEKAAINVGAGNLTMERMEISDNLDFSIGMGHADVKAGVIAGDANLDCGMGDIVMSLEGSEADYNSTIGCGMGTVQFGNSVFQTGDHEINRGAAHTMDIDCGMGSVGIQFQ